MSFAFQTGLLLVLLIICCFAPGFFVVRHLRLRPMEKLCASVGLSIVLVYLVVWGVYVIGGGTNGTPLPATPFFLSSIACAVLLIVSWRELRRLLGSFRVKHALFGSGFLLLWTVVILSMIRVYSGAGWSGDWQEHFQRTIFFLERLPADTIVGNVYQIPARPPLMNVVAAYFLAQTQHRFEYFQIVFTFLNLLMFLPCCLLLPLVSTRHRTRLAPLVLVFAMNPVVMQNATYSWTKGLTAFFVVLGAALYITAWRKDDTLRMVFAFVFLAAGILSHYSAGPYVVFITAHYVFWLFWKRPGKWKEFAAIFAGCLVLLSTWFAWSFVTYGKSTLLSNTTVTSTQSYEGNNVLRVIANLADSILPAHLRDPGLLKTFEQPNVLGTVRDVAFVFYQTNVLFAMGVIGGPAVVWLLFRRLRGGFRKDSSEASFWLGLILFSIVVGVAAVGERDPLGVAHGTLLSVEIMGLALLASVLPRRRTLMMLVVAGCLLDFSFGILLHAHVQSLENDGPQKVFNEAEYSNGTIQHVSQNPHALSDVAWINWFAKHQRALCEKWLRELPEHGGSDPSFLTIWPAAQAELIRLRSQDDNGWGGWYSRHGGEIGYLGDHVAAKVGEIVPLSTLVILGFGLAAVTIQQAKTETLRTVHKPVRPRTRKASR